MFVIFIYNLLISVRGRGDNVDDSLAMDEILLSSWISLLLQIFFYTSCIGKLRPSIQPSSPSVICYNIS